MCQLCILVVSCWLGRYQIVVMASLSSYPPRQARPHLNSFTMLFSVCTGGTAGKKRRKASQVQDPIHQIMKQRDVNWNKVQLSKGVTLSHVSETDNIDQLAQRG